MMKNKILGAAVLASTFALPAFATDVITFDADGSLAENSSQEILTLDWGVGASLADEAVGDQGPEGEFVVYSHGALAGVSNPDSLLGDPTGLNTSYEITFISGFSEVVQSVTQSATTLHSTDDGAVQGDGTDIYTFTQTVVLVEGVDQTVNFFEIYYDDLNNVAADGTLQANNLSGLGFGDGDLILSGTIAESLGEFTTTFVFIDVDANGVYTPGVDTITETVVLDGVDPDQWSGQQTVEGQGTTDIEVNVTFQDYDFFQDDISGLLADLFFNTSNILPFESANPSKSFDDGSGGTLSLANTLMDLGDINGATGPDFLFQSDANNAFVVTRTVPEPGAMMLFGLGLFALGFSRRKKLS